MAEKFHKPRRVGLYGSRAPRDVDVLNLRSPRSRPSNRRGRPSFRPWHFLSLSNIFGYKTRVSGRKQGISERQSNCHGQPC